MAFTNEHFRTIEMNSKELTPLEWLQQEVVLSTKVPIFLDELLVFNGLIEQAKEMQNEQIKPLFNYIEEVMNMCNRREFPSEKELRDLYFKAEQILLTFKSTIK